MVESPETDEVARIKEARKKISNATKSREMFGYLLLNLETGIYYNSIMAGARSLNMKKSTLTAMISNRNPNRTHFIRV